MAISEQDLQQIDAEREQRYAEEAERERIDQEQDSRDFESCWPSMPRG